MERVRETIVSLTFLSLLLAGAGARADPAAELTSGEAWEEFCERMKAMGERIL